METTGINNLLRVLLERRAKKWVSSWSEFGVKRKPMSLGSSKDSSSSSLDWVKSVGEHKGGPPEAWRGEEEGAKQILV